MSIATVRCALRSGRILQKLAAPFLARPVTQTGSP
jgi:hypothetical protein